ncbi:MAG: tRNA lysidine(34) synthetase TilS [Verrucomicrobiales bacterium]|nr:tRNA lysidine(34) synthetase TilS [Verrucomicrobiales bacterium]
MLPDDFSPDLFRRYSPKRKYLIGVSGGRDSMALLHLLHRSGFSKLVVCHVDHGLRGRSSTADAGFVRKVAADLGLTFESRKIEVRKRAKETGQSLETAARHARHEFFAEVSTRHRCRDVFLAHHAGDQIETVLINLFRGTGIRGLAGMQAQREIRVGRKRIVIHRPLLGIRRAEIDRFVKENEIGFREDESNSDPALALRNRVRHQLIPELNEIFGRDTGLSIQRLAKVMGHEESLREQQTSTIFGRLVDEKKRLDARGLQKLETADQFRVVLRWLAKSRVPDCGFEEAERVLTLLSESGQPAKINLPGNRHARRRSGRIFLEKS